LAVVLQFDISEVTRGRAQVQPAKLDFLQKLHFNHRWASSDDAKADMVAQLKAITQERYPTSDRSGDEELLRRMIEIDRVRRIRTRLMKQSSRLC
jgi:hypothetical protein